MRQRKKPGGERLRRSRADGDRFFCCMKEEVPESKSFSHQMNGGGDLQGLIDEPYMGSLSIGEGGGRFSEVDLRGQERITVYL